MFIFKGISSSDMQVVVEEEKNLLGRAPQRYIQTDIAGRDGAEFEEQGYTVLDKDIKFSILNDEKLDAILDWLDGVGILEIDNRITKARFYSEASPVREGPILTIETTFIRDPFWLKKDDYYVKATSSIYNNGNVYSEPIIKLVKKTSNTVDIKINNVRFQYDFNNDDYVEIDCETKKTLYNGLGRDRKITIGYEFPKLKVGENEIQLYSGDTEIYIKRKDRWR